MRTAFTAFSILVFALAAAANPLPEGYAGMDKDDDFVCNPDEMGFDLTAGDQGQVFSVDVYFDAIGAGMVSVGCTFCVQDKSLVSGETFTYALPGAWTASPMFDSDNDVIVVSDWIQTAYPNYKCYLVQGTDFTFSEPAFAPASLGTFSFTYAAAEDGCVGFVIDGTNTAYLTIGFISGNMGVDGQTCPPYDCGGTTATQSDSWGGVKALFR